MSAPYQGLASNITQYSAATVTNATNASPIAITSSAAHNYASGDTVVISGVLGNTAANGTFAIVVTGSNTFTLTGSTGSGAYTSGGAAKDVALLPYSSTPSNGDVFTVDQINAFMQNASDKIQFLALAANNNFTLKTQAFTASGSFTVPPGCTALLVSAWGGGGGGGGGGSGSTTSSTLSISGGGGAGSIGVVKIIPGVKPSETYTVTVGVSGNGGSGGGSATNGFDGVASSVVGAAGSVIAPGGLGGCAGATGILLSTVPAWAPGGFGPGPGDGSVKAMNIHQLATSIMLAGSRNGLFTGGPGAGSSAIGGSLTGSSASGWQSAEGQLGGAGAAAGTSSGAFVGGGASGAGGGSRGPGAAAVSGGNGNNAGAGTAGTVGNNATANSGAGGSGGGGGGNGSASGGAGANGGVGGSGYVLIAYVSAQ